VTYRSFARTVCVGVLLAAAAGCSARPGGLSTRFVKPGEPTADYDDRSATAPAPGLQEVTRKIRELQERATPQPKTSLLPTLESQNQELATALMRVALSPSAESHRLAAAAYLEAGVADYAFRHYQRALRSAPCDSASFEGLARIWRNWGRPDLGLADAHRAIYCRPHSVSAYNTLGTLLEALGQRSEARTALEFALSLDPNAAFVHNNLCFIAIRAGEGAAAQSACERALELEPGMVTARTNLSLALAMQGQMQRAEAVLLETFDSGRAQFNVGMLRMSVGDYGAAAQAFDAAVTAGSSSGDAWRRAKQARRLAQAQKRNP
jgi:Flp pilus assembly protein TadD